MSVFPRWWDLRRYLRDINPVLLSVVLSVCLVCNSDLELVVNTVFSTMIIMMIIMMIIIRNVVLMSRSLKQGEKTIFTPSLGLRRSGRLGRGKAGCRWGGMPDQRGAGKPGSRELEAAESCGQGGESGAGLLLVLGGGGRAERWNRGDASILVHII